MITPGKPSSSSASSTGFRWGCCRPLPNLSSRSARARCSGGKSLTALSFSPSLARNTLATAPRPIRRITWNDPNLAPIRFTPGQSSRYARLLLASAPDDDAGAEQGGECDLLQVLARPGWNLEQHVPEAGLQNR